MQGVAYLDHLAELKLDVMPAYVIALPNLYNRRRTLEG